MASEQEDRLCNDVRRQHEKCFLGKYGSISVEPKVETLAAVDLVDISILAFEIFPLATYRGWNGSGTLTSGSLKSISMPYGNWPWWRLMPSFKGRRPLSDAVP